SPLCLSLSPLSLSSVCLSLLSPLSSVSLTQYHGDGLSSLVTHSLCPVSPLSLSVSLSSLVSPLSLSHSVPWGWSVLSGHPFTLSCTPSYLHQEALHSYPQMSADPLDSGAVRVRLGGESYNRKTLNRVKRSLPKQQDFKLSTETCRIYSLYHSLHHYKYHTFLHCKREVTVLLHSSPLCLSVQC
uniref:Uncharacterized protein n=1 Tax=Lepisosteus oculatus TaxID=7918 RepID=W5NKM6_LEPOC